MPNEPTDAGRRMGAVLAKLTDRAYEERPGARERCRGCALRLGTKANGCEEPLMDIVKAVAELHPFYCHMGKHPRPLCAGVEALWGTKAGEALADAVQRCVEAKGS